MNIVVKPENVVVDNGEPFALETTVSNCTPGKLTLWYQLPEGTCEFVTPEGPSKVVSHSGVVAGTTGTVRATLRVRSSTSPTATILTVTAQDSAGQAAAAEIVVQLL